MTDGSLTPTLALAYLRELSVDVRSAVVLSASGDPLAGDAELADRARAALGPGGEAVAPDTRVLGDADGVFVVARAANGTAIAVSVGPHALLPLLFHDIETVLGDIL